MEKGMKFQDVEYERQDYEAAQKEIDRFTEEVRQAGSYEQVKEIIFKQEKLFGRLATHSYIAYIRSFLDNTDEYYQKEMGYSMQGLASLETSRFARALTESPFAEDIDGEFGPRYLDNTRNEIRLNSAGTELRMKEEELIGQYQQLKAGLVFELNGKEMSEGELLVYFNDSDREIRKAARIASYEGYLKHKEKFISLLRELVELRNELAKANGFDSYLDYANLKHGRNNYGEKELNSFCNQVKKDLVAFATVYGRAQAKRLGLDKLKAHDKGIVFPEGNPKPVGDEDYMTESAGKMYHGLSREAGEFFDHMVECGLFDIKSSPNKIAGMGFCVGLPDLEDSFIFANCNGTQNDVSVYTHEIGHAFQGYLSQKTQPLADYISPMTDVAEIPSKTMELFAYPYAGEFFGEAGDRFRFAHLQEAMDEITAYCSANEFENYLYTHPQASIEELALEMDRIAKLYDPELDNEEFAGYIRQGCAIFRNMGIYMFPKYLISYALSEMCALEFMKRMEEDREQAWKDYEALCSAGGSRGYTELLELAHLHPAYEDGSVQNSTAYAKEVLTSYLRREGTLE